MIIDPDGFDGWEKDHWKVTKRGNWKEFIAVNGDVMIWLTNPRENSWGIKIGTGTGLNESTHLAQGEFNSRKEAIVSVANFMQTYPEVEFRKNSFPNLVDGDGESIFWSPN